MVNTILHGDCLDVLKTLPDNSVDSVVTDPPYGLRFMQSKWDYDVPSVEVWAECLRVLKPGGHLLAFAGTRTQHRMCCRIEDAGFEIRDMLAWVYGSGFPKSLDVSKAIDKAAGVEFDSVPASGVGFMNADGAGGYNVTKNQLVRKGESTDAARQWAGWGTALKPSLEPVTLARKPLIGTVAGNVLEWGCGGLNIDGTRVGTESTLVKRPAGSLGRMNDDGWEPKEGFNGSPLGRWPANFIHDGSEEVTDLLGNAARFFYCAKASKSERDRGCEGLDLQSAGVHNSSGRQFNPICKRSGKRIQTCDCGACEWDTTTNPKHRNNHPTVKPLALMRYLCRLVTPPKGLLLDPFAGSGSTLVAAMLEGFRFVGIEREAEYVEIIKRRLDGHKPKQNLFSELN